MKDLFKKGSILLLVLFIFFLGGCSILTESLDSKTTNQIAKEQSVESSKIIEGEFYYEKEDVAEYIHLYDSLPENYITKSEAEERNWSTEDSTYVVGGDRFGNREGKLPKEKNREYYEADLQTGYTNHRGPERIVYSNDGLIFYTEDHYESFEQLYWGGYHEEIRIGWG